LNDLNIPSQRFIIIYDNKTTLLKFQISLLTPFSSFISDLSKDSTQDPLNINNNKVLNESKIKDSNLGLDQKQDAHVTEIFTNHDDQDIFDDPSDVDDQIFLNWTYIDSHHPDYISYHRYEILESTDQEIWSIVKSGVLQNSKRPDYIKSDITFLSYGKEHDVKYYKLRVYDDILGIVKESETTRVRVYPPEELFFNGIAIGGILSLICWVAFCGITYYNAYYAPLSLFSTILLATMIENPLPKPDYYVFQMGYGWELINIGFIMIETAVLPTAWAIQAILFSIITENLLWGINTRIISPYSAYYPNVITLNVIIGILMALLGSLAMKKFSKPEISSIVPIDTDSANPDKAIAKVSGLAMGLITCFLGFLFLMVNMDLLREEYGN
jgi:hypothetical protein